MDVSGLGYRIATRCCAQCKELTFLKTKQRISSLIESLSLF